LKKRHFPVNRYEAAFLVCIYLVGLYLRLAPRLEIDPHLLTFQGDIWYRIAMAQHILDHHALPEPDIRYLAYGSVPMWYPPLSPLFFAFLGALTRLDLPTVSSRLLPFFESLSPLSLYLLGRYMYGERAAVIATLTLTLTPSFVFWAGISDPQSFNLFLIPLLLLLWMQHAKKPDNSRLLVLGAVLGISFLTHLSYFLILLILLLVSIALVIEGEAGKGLFLDLAKVTAVSQLIALPWWLPRNLYWWWINALVTSSGMYPIGEQLSSYGTFVAILGALAFLYLPFLRRHRLVVLLWALPLVIETQNEHILFAAGRVDLTWHTLFKPLEGFRFYCFLAQPAALAIGAGLDDFWRRLSGVLSFQEHRVDEMGFLLLTALLVAGLAWGIGNYNLATKFQTSGLVIEEYEAAAWFRGHSAPGDRIVADYYRGQMLGGGGARGKGASGGHVPP